MPIYDNDCWLLAWFTQIPSYKILKQDFKIFQMNEGDAQIYPGNQSLKRVKIPHFIF